MIQEFCLKTKETTKILGKKIAHLIDHNPCLIFLIGDLGSGKTTLAKSIIRNIKGKDELVTSPTYTYMNIYPKNPIIYHFDLYRLENIIELEHLGLLEYIEDKTAIRIIEWPQKF